MSKLPAQSGATCQFRVLLVDDDQNVLKTLQRVLEDDFDVTTCDSALEASLLVRKNSYHVVCSDLEMPGMDGVEFLRIVSKLPLYTSCLVLTGSDGSALGSASRYYVLLKPVDPERLISMLMQLARVTEMKRSVGLMTTSVLSGGPKK